jgi:hypothetical protein
MSYAIVRTDLMSGTKQPADLVSVRYAPSGTNTAIENGNFVLLGALDTSNRNVYVGATPARDSARDDVVLIASVELMADERLKSKADFRNAAGAICRGYRLRSGNIFSVSKSALGGDTAAIGKVVELVAGTEAQCVAALTSGSTKIGDVIAIESDFVVIKVS